ncbi:MAG: energy transducer TonB [Prevotellaceae bacterium]|jgi:protein TonB|nr:energy transducer TonB [Prevotellaceae bacterium]
MKKLLTIALLLLSCNIVFAQKDVIISEDISPKATTNDTTIYLVPDIMAQFPGGNAAMYSWLSNNVHYPEPARDSGIQGRVLVQFIVEKDGSLSNLEILRGIEELDTEALRLVKMMPEWIPARLNGKILRSQVILPITFKLAKTK